MNKQAEFDIDQIGEYVNSSKDYLKKLFTQYPALKTLGGMAIGGLLGNVGGRTGRAVGLNVNPTLTGWVGALAPLAIGAITGSQTMQNLDRWGLPGLYTPMRILRNQPNRRGYIAKHLSRQAALGDLPNHQLLYNDIGKRSPIFDARTDYQKDLDDANADAKLKEMYD